MTSGGASGKASFAEPPTVVSPTAENDVMRGRKRERSMTRGTNLRALRAAPSDESSTLRGRSRRRAVSPSLGYTSRASSPRRVLSPTRRRLLHARLRREHCPSRVASPVEQQRPFRRRQRTRSRSRGPRLEMELEASRQADVLSGLRNEVLASSSDEKDAAKTDS
ncbi:hypothetical protein ACJ41O_007865 [Fusarium nematophilum]